MEHGRPGDSARNLRLRPVLRLCDQAGARARHRHRRNETGDRPRRGVFHHCHRLHALGQSPEQETIREVVMAAKDRVLVLVRHGQSEWNLKNLFTGWRDVGLTEQGIKEARAAGRKLKAQGIVFDVAFTSALKRAQHTLDLMLAEMGETKLPVIKDQALNERDYGDLSGLNKDDARKKWGEEQVHIWRRSYD